MMGFLSSISSAATMVSTTSLAAKPYTHPFVPPVPLDIEASGSSSTSSKKEPKPFDALEHYTAQVRAQNASYAYESGLFGTNQFPANSISIRRVDDALAQPLRPGQEARLLVEVDTTQAAVAEEWKRVEVRWFGVLTTWGEMTTNGCTTVNVEHRPLFAYAAPLWNNGTDPAIGGRSLIYEDHIVSKRSKYDTQYLRASAVDQPAPSYSTAIGEKRGFSVSDNPHSAFEIAVRLPDEEAARGLLPATYRGDGAHNVGRQVAQVFYCVQVIAKRKFTQKDRRVCAPIWVSPGNPQRDQSFNEKHGLYHGDYDSEPEDGPSTLDANGIPIGWSRLCLLEESLKSWFFKKIASIRVELYTSPLATETSIPSSKWIPFQLQISALYKDDSPPSVEYQPELILRRREIRTHYGTSTEYRPLQVVYENSATDGGAFYWKDDVVHPATKRATLRGKMRLDCPPGFKNEYPALVVEYDLRLHWIVRSGHRFEKTLVRGLQIRSA